MELAIFFKDMSIVLGFTSRDLTVFAPSFASRQSPCWFSIVIGVQPLE